MTWVELFLVGGLVVGCLVSKYGSKEEIQSKLSQARQGVETFGCMGSPSTIVLCSTYDMVW